MRDVLTPLAFREQSAPSTPASGYAAIYAGTDGLFYGIDDTGTVTLLSNSGGSGTIVVPETHTYGILGSFTTSTVFPPFYADESVGTLVLTRARYKLTSGTATIKIRVNGTDEVTGLNVTSTAATTDFADENIADVDSIDIVCTAASSPVDLSFTLFFQRTLVTSGASFRVEDEGSTIVSTATALNFVGSAVTVTDAGSNEATVTITGGGLRVEDEGSSVVAAATGINFVGSAVTVTDAGSNEATVTVTGGSGDEVLAWLGV